MARAIIVGCGGQDGHLLWQQLAEQGFSLVGISRSGVQTHDNDWKDSVDIDEPADVLRLVGGFRPDQIYFLAAHHHSSQDQASTEAAVWTKGWKVHVQAFLHFLQAVKACDCHARLFYASSSRVFGHASVSPQTESTPMRPICLYGISKATGMMLARFHRESYGVWVSCGILYNHESPLRRGDFVSQKVANTLVAIKYGAKSRLEIGDLEARVDWGYAPDYTKAMQLILSSKEPDDFIVATGRTHTVREMIEVASDCLGLEWKRVVVETPGLLQRPPLPLCGDASHLRARTGWQPSTSFAGMVEYLVRAAEKAHRAIPGEHGGTEHAARVTNG